MQVMEPKQHIAAITNAIILFFITSPLYNNFDPNFNEFIILSHTKINRLSFREYIINNVRENKKPQYHYCGPLRTSFRLHKKERINMKRKLIS